MLKEVDEEDHGTSQQISSSQNEGARFFPSPFSPRSDLQQKNHANKKALQIVGGPLAPNKFLGKDPDPMMQALLV